MASVFERNGSWYLRVKTASGHWKRTRTEARTKTEALRMARDLERSAERQRLGLEAGRPEDGGGTLEAMLRWWLDTYSKGTPSHSRAVSTIGCHFFGSELGRVKVADVRAGMIEVFLQAKAATVDDKGRVSGLAPQSLNHLRRYLFSAFSCAHRAGRFLGPNPAADVKRRKVPKRVPDYLRLDEVPRVLTSLTDRWRPLFATAIYTGLRKGELLGLRKQDVDLANRLLTVGHSYGRATTKGGHADVIPLAVELLPYLETAIRASPSELVFPATDGTMQRPDVALEGVLRRAMGRAGIVTGYTHKCRKQGCEHKEEAPEDALRRCPEHGAKLWPIPKVRQIRFHDLRHTCGSLLFMAGANPIAVQRLLRHSNPKTTTEIYGHLAPGYLRSEVDRLQFNPATTSVTAPAEPVQAVANSTPFSPVVAPDSTAPKENPEAALISQATPGLSTARSRGLEPLTFGVTGRRSNQLN
jgi:integrase